MLKPCRVTKVKVLFLVLVYVFNFNLFEFSAAILEKGLLFARLFGLDSVWLEFQISFSHKNAFVLLKRFLFFFRKMPPKCSNNAS